MTAVVRLEGLELTYPNGYTALKGIDLEVEEGSFLVVIGLSGSGKSSLVRCVNRLVEPTAGRVEVLGEDVTHVRRAALRRLRTDVAMIFQQFNLVKRASVGTNVLTGCLERHPLLPSLLGWWRREEREQAERVLATVRLSAHARHRADALSGGQQQRVAIGRALMQRPKILLADEPVASLDPATSHSIMDVLRQLREDEGITVVANLHFLSLAREYATRVVALKDGRLVFDGSPAEITDDVFRDIYGQDAVEVEVR